MPRLLQPIVGSVGWIAPLFDDLGGIIWRDFDLFPRFQPPITFALDQTGSGRPLRHHHEGPIVRVDDGPTARKLW
jgi:hypothetical protein